MSESNEVRRVCPLCGTLRRDFAARAGLRKVWTCFHCRRTFWPPKSKDSVLVRIRTLLNGEGQF
jgi:hypothetical protein